jgi:cytochrome o ubiquinol oxidase subunit 1
MLGKLTWDAIPFDQPIPFAAIARGARRPRGRCRLHFLEGLVALSVARMGHQRRPQAAGRDVRPARAGDAGARLHRRADDALQQALAAGGAQGYLPPEHYDQIFSAHGTIMIFFVGMPFVIGLMNFVVPLQLGVRDVAFPVLKSVSFWLTASGALLVNVSLFVGEFAHTGWLVYPPLSEIAYSPGRRRRLLPVGAADLRRRHADDRHQLHHHHPEAARARAWATAACRSSAGPRSPRTC